MIRGETAGGLCSNATDVAARDCHWRWFAGHVVGDGRPEHSVSLCDELAGVPGDFRTAVSGQCGSGPASARTAVGAASGYWRTRHIRGRSLGREYANIRSERILIPMSYQGRATIHCFDPAGALEELETRAEQRWFSHGSLTNARREVRDDYFVRPPGERAQSGSCRPGRSRAPSGEVSSYSPARRSRGQPPVLGGFLCRNAGRVRENIEKRWKKIP
jgi:hypothetical protein